MTRSLLFRGLPAVLALSLALPSLSLAQSRQAGSAAQLAAAAATDDEAPSGSAAAPQPGHSRAERFEERITRMHQRLGITAAQEPQWQQVVGVIRENAQSVAKESRERTEKLGSMNAAEGMQAYAHAIEQRAENAQRLATAFQPLYAVFDDQQKREADQVFHDFLERMGGRQRRG